MQLPSEIEERIENLPEEAQQFIRNPQFETTVAQIGLRNGVHIDEIQDLALITLRIITGIIPKEETRSAFMDFGLDVSRTQKLVEDLNRNIFAPFTHIFEESGGIKRKRPGGQT